MGAGVPVSASYDVLKGKVVAKRLKPLLVRNGDHDRTISRLRSFVLYPSNGAALVRVNVGSRSYKLRLVAVALGRRSRMYRTRV